MHFGSAELGRCHACLWLAQDRRAWRGHWAPGANIAQCSGEKMLRSTQLPVGRAIPLWESSRMLWKTGHVSICHATVVWVREYLTLALEWVHIYVLWAREYFLDCWLIRHMLWSPYQKGRKVFMPTQQWSSSSYLLRYLKIVLLLQQGYPVLSSALVRILCMARVFILTLHERMPRGWFSTWFWRGKENLLQKLGQTCIIHIMFPLKQGEEVLNCLETHLAGSSQSYAVSCISPPHLNTLGLT